jgi:hypothetical protein
VKLKGKGNQIQFTFNSEIIVDLQKLQKHISQTISHRPIKSSLSYSRTNAVDLSAILISLLHLFTFRIRPEIKLVDAKSSAKYVFAASEGQR